MSKEILIIIAVVAVLILLCFCLAIANFSSERFLARLTELEKKPILNSAKPIEYINYLNGKYFGGKIKIAAGKQRGGDAYAKGMLFLSQTTLSSDGLASYTIISHEFGHALQDKEGNKLKILTTFRIIGKFLGLVMLPALFAGLILLFFANLFTVGIVLVSISFGIFLLALGIKLATISIEKDASKKALVFLSELLTKEELKVAKKFLNDAKLNYWADFFRAILSWTMLTRKSKLFR